MNENTTRTNPLYYIRQKCLDCSAGSSQEVELCPVKNCPLWIMRHGKNPLRKKAKLTIEQKEARMKNLQKARAKSKQEG